MSGHKKGSYPLHQHTYGHAPSSGGQHNDNQSNYPQSQLPQHYHTQAQQGSSLFYQGPASQGRRPPPEAGLSGAAGSMPTAIQVQSHPTPSNTPPNVHGIDQKSGYPNYNQQNNHSVTNMSVKPQVIPAQSVYTRSGGQPGQNSRQAFSHLPSRMIPHNYPFPTQQVVYGPYGLTQQQVAYYAPQPMNQQYQIQQRSVPPMGMQNNGSLPPVRSALTPVSNAHVEYDMTAGAQYAPASNVVPAAIAPMTPIVNAPPSSTSHSTPYIKTKSRPNALPIVDPTTLKPIDVESDNEAKTSAASEDVNEKKKLENQRIQAEFMNNVSSAAQEKPKAAQPINDQAHPAYILPTLSTQYATHPYPVMQYAGVPQQLIPPAGRIVHQNQPQEMDLMNKGNADVDQTPHVSANVGPFVEVQFNKDEICVPAMQQPVGKKMMKSEDNSGGQYGGQYNKEGAQPTAMKKLVKNDELTAAKLTIIPAPVGNQIIAGPPRQMKVSELEHRQQSLASLPSRPSLEQQLVGLNSGMKMQTGHPMQISGSHPLQTGGAGHPSQPSSVGYPSQTGNSGYPSLTSNAGYSSQTSNSGYPSLTSGAGYPSQTSSAGYPSQASNVSQRDVDAPVIPSLLTIKTGAVPMKADPTLRTMNTTHLPSTVPPFPRRTTPSTEVPVAPLVKQTDAIGAGPKIDGDVYKENVDSSKKDDGCAKEDKHPFRDDHHHRSQKIAPSQQPEIKSLLTMNKVDGKILARDDSNKNKFTNAVSNKSEKNNKQSIGGNNNNNNNVNNRENISKRRSDVGPVGGNRNLPRGSAPNISDVGPNMGQQRFSVPNDAPPVKKMPNEKGSGKMAAPAPIIPAKETNGDLDAHKKKRKNKSGNKEASKGESHEQESSSKTTHKINDKNASSNVTNNSSQKSVDKTKGSSNATKDKEPKTAGKKGKNLKSTENVPEVRTELKSDNKQNKSDIKQDKSNIKQDKSDTKQDKSETKQNKSDIDRDIPESKPDKNVNKLENKNLNKSEPEKVKESSNKGAVLSQDKQPVVRAEPDMVPPAMVKSEIPSEPEPVPISEPTKIDSFDDEPLSDDKFDSKTPDYDRFMHSPEGKKIYSVDELRNLRDSPLCKERIPTKLFISRDTPSGASGRSHSQGYFPASNQRDFMPNFARSDSRQSNFQLPNRKSQQGRDRRDKPMPGTMHFSLSSKDDVQLKQSSNAWKPMHLMRENMTQEEKETKALFMDMTDLLNKLTPEKFHVIVGKIKELKITTKERMDGIIGLIFQKAIDEPGFCRAYAELCKEIQLTTVPDPDKPDKNYTFRVGLINKCQTQFEKEKADELDVNKRQAEIDECTNPEKKKELQFAFDEEERKIRRKSVGNCRFIGELFKLQMLTYKIMHRCLSQLMQQIDEESLECACKLLTTTGKVLEEKSTKEEMDNHFKTIDQILSSKKNPKISSRIKFMLQDVAELRENRWKPRRDENNPKTIEEINEDIKRKEAEDRMYASLPLKSSQQQDNRYGGGGRSERDKRAGGNRSMGGGGGQSDDGWKTVQSKAYRGAQTISVDTDKFKNLALNLGGPPTLGGRAAFSSWGSGAGKNANSSASSRNSFSSIQAQGFGSMSDRLGPPSSSPMSSTLNSRNASNRTTPSSSLEKKDRDSMYTTSSLSSSRDSREGWDARNKTVSSTPSLERPAPKPAPVVKEMSDDDIAKKSNVIVEELKCNPGQLQESYEVMRDTFSKDLMPKAVNKLILTCLEKDAKYRESCGRLFSLLIEKNEMTTQTITSQLPEIFEFQSDLLVDYPKLWEFLAEILWPVLREEKLILPELLNAAAKSEFEDAKNKFIINIIEKVKKEKGVDWLMEKWKKYGLKLQDYISSNMIKDCVKKHSLEYLIGGECIKERKDEKKDLLQEFVDILNEPNAYDLAIKYISGKNIDKSDPKFISTLTTAICRVCIDDKYEVDKRKFEKLSLLIKGYTNLNTPDDAALLRCLTAINSYVSKLSYPKGMLLLLFETLYDCHVIPFESFLDWKNSNEVIENKGVAMGSLNSFFSYLMEQDQRESATKAAQKA